MNAVVACYSTYVRRASWLVSLCCALAACDGSSESAASSGESAAGRAASVPDASLGPTQEATAATSGSSGAAAGAAGSRSPAAGSAATASAGREGAAGSSTPGANDDRDAGSEELDAGGEPAAPSGSFIALTYNVAGLPEGLSSSMPMRNTPLIAPLLEPYDLVFLQESWQTPDPNPFAPLRGYHEILVAGASQPYKTTPDEQPFGSEPTRPTALLGDGLNIFSRVPLEDTTRVAWPSCVDTEADCLAMKGFSHTPARIGPDLPVHLYDLHMEAGSSPEDERARAAGIDQLLAFVTERSRDVALIVAGDFNLRSDQEPAKSQLARLLQGAGLKDSCAELACPAPGNIDKVLYRSSAQLQLEPEVWRREADVFVTADGEPLSDHTPISVRFSWRGKP